ncbi:hypothetical protein [Accumulibacter sp.]|uniref:hypothetical protein n=1 Tax=Accumulibacter sp. TaxID=2053492 RepID=UPI002CAC3A63|nr:hypothetical protein [Accumulibacter sp.]HPU81055.1 hypothetical protein [Accumulibacter sp.]
MHSHLFRFEFVNVLSCLRIELEGGKDEQFRLGVKRPCFLPRMFHLALFQWRMLRAKGDHHTLRVVLLRLALGMQPAATGQRLKAAEADVLPAFPPDARSQQFIAPFGLTQRFARPGNRGIGRLGWRLQNLIHRFHHRRWYRFNREGAGHPHLLAVHQRLVVERLLRRMAGDGRVHRFLHVSASGVKSVKGVARLLRPIGRKLERHFPFHQLVDLDHLTCGHGEGLAIGGRKVHKMPRPTALGDLEADRFAFQCRV